MATKRKQPVSVKTLTHHEATRANIPTTEYQPVVGPHVSDSVAVPYLRAATSLAGEKAQRNRDLDPQLIWRGKDEQDWSRPGGQRAAALTSRDVKDGNPEHIIREPEQVKAFRDTWHDGIHSYLTYLCDRLTVARDLLTESGSIFVQTRDENVHRVRAVMDEVPPVSPRAPSTDPRAAALR